MCGFAGQIATNAHAASVYGDTNLALVESMCDVLQHRGPDDSGVEIAGPAVLGSRRLSIIDLSAAGRMPMSDPSGRWRIVYNGEVYNFAEIRVELETLGHSFASNTDTEVVLHAWMQWGKDCLQRFNGMFAFAIVDTQKHEVFLVRDRYGIKPLYYVQKGESLFFASEIKALFKVIEKPTVDRHSMIEWLLYRGVDALTPETMTENVNSLLPGQIIAVTQAGVNTSAWYRPEQFVTQAQFDRFRTARPLAIVDEVDSVLNDAVRSRLVSDVPVGTLLSGGLDSSLVTSIAVNHTPHLHTFHVSVEGYPDLDERRFAEQVARQHQLPFIPFSLTAKRFRRELARTAYLSDLPLSHPNTVAYSLICNVARAHGVIVLLSGEGADELFGGYSWSYRRRMRLSQLDRLLRFVPRKIHELAALIVYSHAGMPISTRRFREVLPVTIDFLDRFARQERLDECESAYAFVKSRTQRGVLGGMLADLSDYLSPLLRRLDRASMGASVECRVPFLDHRLVHRAINMPLEYKVGRRADKWVLKKVASGYISPDLIARKKAGFPLPFDDYIRPLADPRLFSQGFCEEVLGIGKQGLRHEISSRDQSAFALFGWVALEIWGRIHFMGESIEQVTDLIERIEYGSN